MEGIRRFKSESPRFSHLDNNWSEEGPVRSTVRPGKFLPDDNPCDQVGVASREPGRLVPNLDKEGFAAKSSFADKTDEGALGQHDGAYTVLPLARRCKASEN